MESKYLKYKKKYLALQDILTYSWNSNNSKGLLEHMNKKKYLNFKKLYGGAIKNKTKREIIYGYETILNKGTQNCGVYINKKEPNKILLCNKSKLNSNQNDFLFINRDNNLQVYPILYESYDL